MSKVLVIDDDANVRVTLQAVLEDAGYEVTLADDGLRGYAAFKREQGEHPNTKIIAISGGARSSNFDYLQLACKFGAKAVLPKPFDPDCLLTMISDCLLAA